MIEETDQTDDSQTTEAKNIEFSEGCKIEISDEEIQLIEQPKEINDLASKACSLVADYGSNSDSGNNFVFFCHCY
jgi:SAM-dependent MidA family methyltransferase